MIPGVILNGFRHTYRIVQSSTALSINSRSGDCSRAISGEIGNKRSACIVLIRVAEKRTVYLKACAASYCPTTAWMLKCASRTSIFTRGLTLECRIEALPPYIHLGDNLPDHLTDMKRSRFQAFHMLPSMPTNTTTRDYQAVDLRRRNEPLYKSAVSHGSMSLVILANHSASTGKAPKRWRCTR